MNDVDLQREINIAEKRGEKKRAEALDKVMLYRYIEYHPKKALKAQEAYERKYKHRLNVVT